MTLTFPTPMSVCYIADRRTTMQKIPIERIRHRLAGHKKSRTSRACDLCRRRKRKCDGRKPPCSQCEGLAVSTCVYSEGKHSQDRRQLESATSKIKAYEELLQDIRHTVGRSTSKRIANTITVSHSVRPLKIRSGVVNNIIEVFLDRRSARYTRIECVALFSRLVGGD